jgi:3-oxoadipate enol-lactonase
MPSLEINGARLHFQWDGPAERPVVLFSNSLGTNFSMWDAQIPKLSHHFRLLRYDMRGHGESSLPAGPCTIDRLGSDAIAILDALGVERVSFCGLSLGGAIGQWLGIHHPERLGKLILANTAAKFGKPEDWTARIDQVRLGGIQSLLPGLLNRWLTADFQAAKPEVVARVRGMLLSTSPDGYISCCTALREIDQRALAHHIATPALVISGANDEATPAVQGESLARTIPGARFLCLPAAHLSNVEAASSFTEAVFDFLTE